jgi:hypothetical protein
MPSRSGPEEDRDRLVAFVDDLKEALSSGFGGSEEVFLTEPSLTLGDVNIAERRADIQARTGSASFRSGGIETVHATIMWHF